jgi:NitT/TauT family transport system ATP-binding protein
MPRMYASLLPWGSRPMERSIATRRDIPLRMSLLEIKGVSMQFFADGKEMVALQDINLNIEENEFVCFIGPSGCGKTTLLRIVAGLEEATEGTVTLDGDPIKGPGPERGMVFQEYSLFPWRTVIDNIVFGLELKGIPSAERLAQGRQYLKMVELERFETRYPHELSGGMKQRVAIARALVNHPKALLMDEPFGALDAQTRNIMQSELLRIWQEERKTVVFVTHSVDEAIYLADRIVIMSARPGRIKDIIDIPLARPRNRTSSEVNLIRDRILCDLRSEIATC